jgi:hypothetical protein
MRVQPAQRIAAGGRRLLDWRGGMNHVAFNNRHSAARKMLSAVSSPGERQMS